MAITKYKVAYKLEKEMTITLIFLNLHPKLVKSPPTPAPVPTSNTQLRNPAECALCVRETGFHCVQKSPVAAMYVQKRLEGEQEGEQQEEQQEEQEDDLMREESPEGRLWSVQPLAGRGLGVVALVAIPAGTLLMEDCPLVTVPSRLHTKYYTLSMREGGGQGGQEEESQLQEAGEELAAHLSSCVRQLPAKERRLFWSLADCKAGPGPSTESGVYFSNCYMLGEGRGAASGVLPTISR